MKNTYLSIKDFERNCPCAFQLNDYADSLSTNKIQWHFNMARKILTNTNNEIYIATYDAPSSTNPNFYELEISCTILSNHEYLYKIIRRTDN